MVLLIKNLLSKLRDSKSTTKFISFSLICIFFSFIFFCAFRDKTGNLAWTYDAANFIAGLLHLPVSVLVFVYFIIQHFSKKRGEGRPLSSRLWKQAKRTYPKRFISFAFLFLVFTMLFHNSDNLIPVLFKLFRSDHHLFVKKILIGLGQILHMLTITLFRKIFQ